MKSKQELITYLEKYVSFLQALKLRISDNQLELHEKVQNIKKIELQVRKQVGTIEELKVQESHIFGPIYQFLQKFERQCQVLQEMPEITPEQIQMFDKSIDEFIRDIKVEIDRLRVTVRAPVRDNLNKKTGISYEIKTSVLPYDFGKGIVAQIGPQSVGMYLEGNNSEFYGNFEFFVNIYAPDFNINTITLDVLNSYIKKFGGKSGASQSDFVKFRKAFEDIQNHFQKTKGRSIYPETNHLFAEFNKSLLPLIDTAKLGPEFNETVYERAESEIQHFQIADLYNIPRKNVLGGFYYKIGIIKGLPTLVVTDSSQMFGSVPNYADIEKYFCNSVGIQSGIELRKRL